VAEPVRASELTDFVARAFTALGVPEADAREVAGLMVEADVLGYETHGVFRLRQYVNRLRAGGCNPAPQVRLVRETAATALVDGDNGLGHLAMARACGLAMVKARAAGIGWVGVHHQAGDRLRIRLGDAKARQRGGDEPMQLLCGDARLSHLPRCAPRCDARRRTGAAPR